MKNLNKVNIPIIDNQVKNTEFPLTEEGKKELINILPEELFGLDCKFAEFKEFISASNFFRYRVPIEKQDDTYILFSNVSKKVFIQLL